MKTIQVSPTDDQDVHSATQRAYHEIVSLAGEIRLSRRSSTSSPFDNFVPEAFARVLAEFPDMGCKIVQLDKGETLP